MSQLTWQRNFLSDEWMTRWAVRACFHLNPFVQVGQTNGASLECFGRCWSQRYNKNRENVNVMKMSNYQKLHLKEFESVMQLTFLVENLASQCEQKYGFSRTSEWRLRWSSRSFWDLAPNAHTEHSISPWRTSIYNVIKSLKTFPFISVKPRNHALVDPSYMGFRRLFPRRGQNSPGVNFIIILREVFCTKANWAAFLCLEFGFERTFIRKTRV